VNPNTQHRFDLSARQQLAAGFALFIFPMRPGAAG
jgi:hypothetical protein